MKREKSEMTVNTVFTAYRRFAMIAIRSGSNGCRNRENAGEI
ncbi:hypothetical protein [Butyrivibrio sp.]|nr:hypothetical protein [Butyrivibrio sp.]